jgi:hypothetical protein
MIRSRASFPGCIFQDKECGATRFPSSYLKGLDNVRLV